MAVGAAVGAVGGSGGPFFERVSREKGDGGRGRGCFGLAGYGFR